MDESVQKHIEESLPKVGRFQEFADAMLRGCRDTYPIKGSYFDGKGGACALGAMFLGIGSHDKGGRVRGNAMDTLPPECAYVHRYGHHIQTDNDSGSLTREEIAARIAAL